MGTKNINAVASELEFFLVGLMHGIHSHVKANDLHVVFSLVQEIRHMYQKKILKMQSTI